MKVDRELIKSLIKNQLLHSIVRENAFFLKVRVSLESVEAFKTNYVLSNTLASEIRSMPKNINQTLAEAGVMPVDDSSETHCFVYRRRDVEGVRIEKKDNRVYTPLLSTAEAAKILNLEEGDVLELVRNGVLMPYHRTENRLKDNPFFTETGIENFKKLGLKNLDVVSRSAAAKIVGIGMTAFKARYLKTKRLIPIEMEGGSRRLLYSIDDVEKVRLMEIQGIRSTEAAEILNVNISCVNKLTLAGQLKPVSGPNVDGFQYNVYIRSEVDALRNERNAFKVGQMKAGKSSRFGRVSGNRYSKRKHSESLTIGGE